MIWVKDKNEHKDYLEVSVCHKFRLHTLTSNIVPVDTYFHASFPFNEIEIAKNIIDAAIHDTSVAELCPFIIIKEFKWAEKKNTYIELLNRMFKWNDEKSVYTRYDFDSELKLFLAGDIETIDGLIFAD